jgi:hypothetical protein
MGRFVVCEDRKQSFLLLQSLDDFVADDNPVRVIEVFIDALDLGGLGFAGVRPATTGLRSGRCVASSLSFAAG